MDKKLCPVGYVRGEDIDVSQIEHFDDVRPYVATVNSFVNWLNVEYGLVLQEAPYADRGRPDFNVLLNEYFEIDEKKLGQERLIQGAHQQHAEQKYPKCVNCKQSLIMKQGSVWLSNTIILAPTHYFGGYVCSEACDSILCLKTIVEMSDSDSVAHASKALEQFKKNWK